MGVNVFMITCALEQLTGQLEIVYTLSHLVYKLRIYAKRNRRIGISESVEKIVKVCYCLQFCTEILLTVAI